MARGSKTWLNKVLEALLQDKDVYDQNFDQDYHRRFFSEKLVSLNEGAPGQQSVFEQLDIPRHRKAFIRSLLAVAGFKDPEDIYSKKFHNVMVDYLNNDYRNIPDAYRWSKNYHKSPFFAAAPEQRIPLEQILKTRAGTIRNPIHSLYRELRGNAMLNPSKDFIARTSNHIWDPQVTTALNKLSKNGYIKYDPKTGVVLIPRDTIRQIDPYYEKYQETLNALTEAYIADAEARYKEDESGEWKLTQPYIDMGKEFLKEQTRRHLPGIAENMPMEMRNQMLAEQQEQLNAPVSDEDLQSAVRQMFNLSSLETEIGKQELPLASNAFNNRMRLASVFSEKGLRSLLNNPKRRLKLAQINELLEDKWQQLHVPSAWHTVRRYAAEEDAPMVNLMRALPWQDRRDRILPLERFEVPGGPWKKGDIHSLNNFDTLRRTLHENELRVAQAEEQARDRVRQYIAAHPELQQLAAQNMQEQAQQQQLDGLRGIGYTPNEEDKEEQRLLERVRKDTYRRTVSNILSVPRLAELAERPYQYSKDILEATNSDDLIAPWRLAKNRRDLYERSRNHNICVGVPVHEYHDKVLQKKSLIFFHGEHTNKAGETGEIALFINPKDHKIIKANVVQVHGFENKPGSQAGTGGLHIIAKRLVGKSVDDINNVVEQKGIEYKEEQPVDPHEVYQQYMNDYVFDNDLPMDDYADRDDDVYEYANEQMRIAGYHMDEDGNWLAPGDPRYDDYDYDGNRIEPEGEFDEDDPGYAGGGFVEPIGNTAYQRLLELLLESNMAKPTKHQISLATRRF
jgi:Mn-dependent DtxR family transcriptional regulator